MPTLYKAPSPKKKEVKKTFHVYDQPGKTRMRPLTSFAVNPQGVRFETQQEEEKVILFLRQHFVVLIVPIFLTILMFLAPTVVFPFLLKFLNLPVAIPVRYIIVGTVFWYLATFGFALANLLYWFFNIYIVTNERVVDIDFMYLLYKDFSQAELNKIQDISYATGGILATIFDFGNVHIETAGEVPNLMFERVPQPKKVVETVRSLSQTESNESI